MYDYDYDDYVEEYEPDPYEQDLMEQYNKVKNEFLLSYIMKHVSSLTFHMIKDVYKKLESIGYEGSSLKQVFISDSVSQIENQDYKKKLLTEVFLYSFTNLNLSNQPEKFLKILYDDDTFETAKLFYKNGHYVFIMKFILDVVNRAEQTIPPSHHPKKSSYTNHSWDDDDGYSDVLYWEAVHDGDINPDEDFSDNGYGGSESYYDYDDSYYEVDDQKAYTDPERIAQKLGKYVSLLQEETSFIIPSHEKKNFLEKFKRYNYTAESILSELKIKDHIDKVFDKLVLLGSKSGLTVERSSSFDKCINFNKQNGNRYLEFTLFNSIDDKNGRNYFSLYVDDLTKNVTNHDLQFTLSVIQTIGYDVDLSYVDYVYEVLKNDDFFADNKKTFRSGITIGAINHGNELRQFLTWQG